MTWDRRLYFSSDGRSAEDFFALKIQQLRPGLNPWTWVLKASKFICKRTRNVLENDTIHVPYMFCYEFQRDYKWSNSRTYRNTLHFIHCNLSICLDFFLFFLHAQHLLLTILYLLYHVFYFFFGFLCISITRANSQYIICNVQQKWQITTQFLSTENKYVEIKSQLDATEVFIADLIACSTCFRHHYAHHQELKSIIQWLLRVVFCAVVFQVAGLVWS